MKYAYFCNVIEKFPRFKKEIDEKEMIYIPAKDLAKEMGQQFKEDDIMVIPIIPPEEIPSKEKRFFSEMIKYIDDIESSYEEKIKFFDVMVEGSKFLLESFHQFEKDLEWYHADVKVSYVSGFRDALNKFNDILIYLSKYADEKDIGEYSHLLVIGENFIQNMIEGGENLPEITNVVKDIDLIKKGEYQKGPFMVQIRNPEHLWYVIKHYINNMK